MAKPEPMTSVSPLQRQWYRKRSSVGTRMFDAVLAPLSWAYRGGLALSKRSTDPVRVEVPVLSIGNLTVGGNGKTPLVIALAQRLGAARKRIAIISRGYGRASRGIQVVQVPGKAPAPVSVAGDEPAMMARRCPDAFVVVGEDRVAAAKEAVRIFMPDIILCDDAFQHRRLHRDLDVVAIHAERGFGNGKLLPRGPLREPIRALQRANLVIFTHAGKEPAARLKARHGVPQELPALCCAMKTEGYSQGPNLEPSIGPGDVPVLAVCAVANPGGFEKSCREAGLALTGVLPFRDHHDFSADDLEKIKSACKRSGARAVVCTEKDLVRFPTEGFSTLVWALRIRARFTDESALERALSRFI